MPKVLSFYDVVKRKVFKSSDYRFVVRGGRRFAVAVSPFTGNDAYRIVGRV